MATIKSIPTEIPTLHLHPGKITPAVYARACRILRKSENKDIVTSWLHKRQGDLNCHDILSLWHDAVQVVAQTVGSSEFELRYVDVFIIGEYGDGYVTIPYYVDDPF